MIIVTRIVNFGIYFRDSYKITIGLILLILFYWLLIKINNYIIKYKALGIKHEN